MSARRFVLQDRIARGKHCSVWSLQPLLETSGTAANTSTVDLGASWGAGPWVVKVAQGTDAHEVATALGDEAVCQARAAGPGVAAVGGIVEVIERATDHVGGPGLVMQRLAGTTLTAFLAGKTPSAAGDPPMEGGSPGGVDVVATLVALARLLGRVHDAGVVHGDVAPDNVLVDGPDVALVDFGSARLVDAARRAPSAGTPGFAAPEVIAGESPTVASDAFGVGALGLYLLDESPGLDGRHGDIVRAWSETLTEWAPDARPDDLGAAAEILEALCGSGSSRSRTVEFGPRPPRHPPGETAVSRRSPVRSVAAVVALCLLGFAGITARHGGASHDGAPTTVIRGAADCRGDERPLELRDGAPRHIDVLGIGCAQIVHWASPVLTVTRHDGTRAGTTRRYVIGAKGDVAFLGVWGCARFASPAIYRPTTGEILTWRALPSTPGVAEGTRPRRTRTGTRNGHVLVQEDRRGCAHLVVGHRSNGDVASRDPTRSRTGR